MLGAGASRPYGFPSGAELVEFIYTHTRSPGQQLVTLLGQCGFGYEQVTEFGRDLKLSGLPSIDSFLEHRKEFRDVGKAAIGAVLLPLENESCFETSQYKANNSPWYDYLVRHAGDLRRIAEKDLLSILTFNYDRSMDYFLYLHFRKAYGMNEEQASQYCSRISIIHLYGKLGELPHTDKEDGLAYGSPVDRRSIEQVTGNIKVMFEGESATAAFEAGINQLQNSEVICFLGFGYHPPNVTRLQFPEIGRQKILVGSGFGITESERNPIRTHFGKRLEMGQGADDTLGFLRNSAVLHSI